MTNNVRFTPDSRHSNRHVRFRIVLVCFWGMNGPMAGLFVESEIDPERNSLTDLVTHINADVDASGQLNMMRLTLLGFMLLLALAGCGMGSHFGADPSEFRYQSPEAVSDADKAECTSRARSAAQQRGWELGRSKGLERTAMWGGVIGAVGAFSYVYEEEEEAYEEEFKTCLEEKGYDLD